MKSRNCFLFKTVALWMVTMLIPIPWVSIIPNTARAAEVNAEECKLLNKNKAFLGIAVQKVDNEPSGRLLVTRVVPGSSASIAGIQPKDIILNIDGKVFNSPDDFVSFVSMKKAGNQINIRLLRGNIIKNIHARLKKKSDRDLYFDCASMYDKAGDKNAAAKWVEMAAERGHNQAQIITGDYYFWGKGVPQDYKKAVYWYKKAAEQGDDVAQYRLGVMYYNGQGVPQDYKKAVYWYKKAAEQGDVRAQCNLGVMYFKEEGVPQDYKKAFKWYKKAAEQGVDRAQHNLGWMYEHSKGVPQDYKKAVYWYKKAAEQGYAYAQSNLGWMYEHSKGVSQDYKQAFYWYKKAAEQGYAYAQDRLGDMYNEGKGVPKNKLEGEKWYKRAAEQGNNSAIEALKDISRETKPFLVLNTGGHQTQITSLDIIEDNKYLLSTSMDKTIRVWDIKTGKVIKILYAPVGAGNLDGVIGAADYCPTTKILAIGTFIGGKSRIYFVNVDSGKVVKYLSDHDLTIDSLAFSPDGNFLVTGASVLEKKARIWDIKSGKILHTLHTENGVNPKCVSFSEDGSKVITASGNDLYLWDFKSGRKIQTLQGHSEKVTGIAVSSGSILSSSIDKTIKEWDSQSGMLVNTITGFDAGALFGVTVSPSGKKFLATGASKVTLFSLSEKEILWQHTNNGPVFFPTMSPDGNFACFGGILNGNIALCDIGNGKLIKQYQGKGDISLQPGFSSDSKTIAWKNNSNKIIEFQLPTEGSSFALNELGNKAAAGKYQKEILSVGSWSIIKKEKLGKSFFFESLQIVRNGEIAHQFKKKDSDFFTSATLSMDGSKLIYAYSGAGQIRIVETATGKIINYLSGHSGYVTGLTVSPDNRLLVSASLDNTVKIWGIASGELLLTIFNDNKNNWVAWAPEGFFDASQGGAKYVGFVINNGKNKLADFISIDQLHDYYYRPDLVALKLSGKAQDFLTAELNKIDIGRILSEGMAPAIEVVSPSPASTVAKREIALKIKMTDQGGGIGKIIYRINGVTIGKEESNRTIVVLGKKEQREKNFIIEKLITLQPGGNLISIVAYNKKNEVESEPVSISVTLQGERFEDPSLYVLSVGIDNYQDGSLKLNHSVADASAFAREIKKSSNKLFKKTTIIQLHDNEASLSGIKKTFENLAKDIKSNDVFILYMAGHGIALDGSYNFIPYDLRIQNENSIRFDSLTQDRLQEYLASVPALKSIVLLDTCNAGAFTNYSRGLTEKTAIMKLMRATGRATISASSGEQVALEGYKGHGVFTYTLLMGLKGEADKHGNNDLTITVNELSDYISLKTPELSYKKWGYEQIPMQDLHGTSFPIGSID